MRRPSRILTLVAVEVGCRIPAPTYLPLLGQIVHKALAGHQAGVLVGRLAQGLQGRIVAIDEKHVVHVLGSRRMGQNRRAGKILYESHG